MTSTSTIVGRGSVGNRGPRGYLPATSRTLRPIAHDETLLIPPKMIGTRARQVHVDLKTRLQ